jgi:pilus assembly protein CpaB
MARNFPKIKTSWLLLGASLLIGGLAAYLGKSYIAEQALLARQAAMPKSTETVSIVVPKRDMNVGDELTAENMAARDVPKEFAPSTAIGSEKFDAAKGQKLSIPIRQGEPMMWQYLERGKNPSFSAKLNRGTRAFTMAVDEINSVSGMVQPGDRVDLLLSLKPPRELTGQAAFPNQIFPLLQGVPVLATGRQTKAMYDETPGPGGQVQTRQFSTITVELPPNAIKRILVAQESGRITAVLRNPDDDTPMPMESTDVTSLFVAQQQSAARPTVEMIIGGGGATERRELQLPGAAPPQQDPQLRLKAFPNIPNERPNAEVKAAVASPVITSR